MTDGLTLSDVRRWMKSIPGQLTSDWATMGRMRVLVIAAGALAWLGLVLLLQQTIETEVTRQNKARAEIARLTSLVSDTSWRNRVIETQDLRTRLESRFWPAPTPGLAEASFEAWLRESLQQHGVEVQQILMTRAALENVDSDGADLPIERMTAKVISTFRAAGAINVAADIAEKDKLVTIDRLIIRTGRNARMEMDVSAYLQK